MDNKTITKINNLIHIIQARINDLQGRIEKLEEFKIYTQELDHEDYNYIDTEEDEDRDNDYINLSRRCDRLESQDEAIVSLIRATQKLLHINENDVLSRCRKIEERITAIEEVLIKSKLVEVEEDTTHEKC